MPSLLNQAAFTLDTHGIGTEMMLHTPANKQSLKYSSIQWQHLYTSYGSILGIGVGYRAIFNALWVVGGHAYLDGGLLPESLGYYTKLNIGGDVHTLQGSLGGIIFIFPSYLPPYPTLTGKNLTNLILKVIINYRTLI
jgi:hypothetical protein